jgi:Arc/MetJ family transcription regulator
MTRITVDVNDEWLEAARQVLGTTTKVATINAALESFAIRLRAIDILHAFDTVRLEFVDPDHAWGAGAGRDLSRLEEKARTPDAAVHSGKAAGC